ncbi:unnamed protein product [Allacma fusca]|uniref:Gamma-soluble NSF attachment protein n=1 Tax=Allacma fusca TaxID=39272 RepID=A0A8J2KCE0_9HEXA|nr:unnamed protein product [Allacma fusca]
MDQASPQSRNYKVMANSAKKAEEALEHIRNAEKSLKTSLLKWKPDYDIAADEYNTAATCYKSIKSYQECKDCLLKAADCHKQNRGLFSAAKCMEQAALICKELGELMEIGKLGEQACHLYQQHGTPDSGALCLDKAAKMIETQHPERAIDLYRRGIDVVMIEDRPRQAAEFCSKMARLLVRLRRYDEAADAIRREISLHQQGENLPAVGRLVVALVLVQLGREDYVAAEKAFKEWGNCCEVEEVQTLEMLLRGYDEEDPEVARKALNSPFIKHMDVEYAKLARDLPLPAGIAEPPRPQVRENAAPSYRSVSQKPTGDAEGGDDEGGLC